MSIRTPVRAAYPPVLGPPVQATSAVNVDAEKALMLKDMQRLEVDARLLTGLTPAQKDLFEYYKYRIETFEHERSEWIHRMDDLEGTRQEYYKLKWELTKRDEQIDELQRALSDAHVFLYEEREQVLKLAAENDELRIQEVEDRKRIQHLLALTQPVSQEVTYFRDCRPGKVSRNYTAIDRQAGTASAAAGASAASSTTTLAARPAAVGSARLGGAPTPAAAAGSKALTRPRTVGSSSVAARSLVPAYTPSSTVAAAGLTRPAGSQRGGQVVRTIYLPNESVDVLKLIVQSLRTQLDEQKCFAEQRCQALTEDRLIREAECKDRVAVARKTVAELQRDLKALMEVHTATTKDYLDLRQELQQKEKGLREECSALSGEVRALRLALSKTEQDRDARAAKRAQESEAFVSMFRNQALGSEEDLAIIKGQYEAAHVLYEKRIKFLESKLAAAADKHRQLQQRRRLEVEGYQADVRGSRERLRALERAVSTMKLPGPEGVEAIDPKVIKLMAFRKDFTDLRTHLADIANRLDKGQQPQDKYV